MVDTGKLVEELPGVEDASDATEGAGEEVRQRRYRQALQRLPLFPLPNVVLFPHALLPLHIFEQRYRKLTRDVLASHRLLALSLLPETEEGAANRSAEAESATAAAISQVGAPVAGQVAGIGEIVMAHELPDGRFNLVVRGKARVRIDEELTSDEPYRLVRATELPDVPGGSPQEIKEADQSLRLLVGRLAEAIPEGGELLRQVVSAQESPGELADVLAAALVVDSRLRQQLLETCEVARRLERLSQEVVAMTGRLHGPSHLS